MLVGPKIWLGRQNRIHGISYDEWYDLLFRMRRRMRKKTTQQRSKLRKILDKC